MARFLCAGQVGKRGHGVGGERCYYGDDGSDPEAGWGLVPGEDRDDGVSGRFVRGGERGTLYIGVWNDSYCT